MKEWTAQIRRDRYPGAFNRSGQYIKGRAAYIKTKPEGNEPKSEDTQNRNKIFEEIKTRCSQGENLDDVVNEIAAREEVQKQFDYYIKNGITDLSKIFKGWYESFKRNEERPKFYQTR